MAFLGGHPTVRLVSLLQQVNAALSDAIAQRFPGHLGGTEKELP
jgi:hypothetical protein